MATKYDTAVSYERESFADAAWSVANIKEVSPLWYARVIEKGYNRWFVMMARPHAMATEPTLAKLQG